MEDLRAIITDIQHFSLHDGPGIRSSVFLKGCNLRCKWCHNPETLSFEPEILIREDKCIHCGHCAEGCFTGARTLCGKEMTVEEVMKDVLQDKAYYGQDGGITVTGGEPTCRPEFTRALLMAAEEAGLHTAMESNLSLPYERISPILAHCRLLLCDLKLWDDDLHRYYTGAGNERIKENIRRASEEGIPMVLHTPVMVGVNDNEQVLQIAEFASTLKSLVCYELLPYHPLGLSKGRVQGYEPQRFEKPPTRALEALAREAARKGVVMRVAGKPIDP